MDIESVDDNSISWKLKYMFVKWYLSLDDEMKVNVKMKMKMKALE